MHEYIVSEKATRGTETSKYPEEKKETSIFQVAASERERGQTFSLLKGLRILIKIRFIVVEDVWKYTLKRVKVP